ncbi:CocE/NonD family hydrolase [Paraburkholderia sp. Ac-20340]|uniref:CocE/NonD family hydrolase n=1 Tax=Paraburkholderia sp. Ac-20340 TaxID=2703888 RepID=UPI001980A404|nr:CocE/NonD family hydrolase [Paraburkholderia sp. Ac-20340]MBN3857936.1 CocE/NonD family hydrolase [Paraburkholderia sp. Ac-20340]
MTTHTFTRSVDTFWGTRITGYFTVSDGTRLRYCALLPNTEEAFPAILKYSGYDSGSLGGKAYLDGNETFSIELDEALVARGYAVVGVSARGTGCSEGQFDFLGHHYGEDGRDVVEQIAAADWCNGAVGMSGWSWAGMSQLATAAQRPAALRAIAPGATLGDPRRDSWAPGGVFAPAFASHWHDYLLDRWHAVELSARAEEDREGLAQLERNRAALLAHSLPRYVITRQQSDAWQEQRALRKITGDIAVPTLSFLAWQDEAVLSREGYYHETLRADLLWLVRTNGGHEMYRSAHFHRTLLAFYDRFVKGDPEAFTHQPRLQLWQDAFDQHGEGKTRDDRAAPGWTLGWPHAQPHTQARAWMLSGDARLSDGHDTNPPSRSYLYPLPGPDVNREDDTDAWGAQPAGWRSGSLAYTSAPLDASLTALGPASVDLWLSLENGPDADIQVTLTEVLADGREMYVQRGWLRLSLRALDKRHSTELRPWHIDRGDAAAPLYPHEAVFARVEIVPFSHTFRCGSALRIWLDTPSRTGGYGFDSISTPDRVTVLHDRTPPSRLVLGVLPDVVAPPERPSPATILKQPLRADPLAAQ